MKHLFWIIPQLVGMLILYLNQGGSGPAFLALLLFLFSLMAALLIKYEDKNGIITGYQEIHTNDR